MKRIIFLFFLFAGIQVVAQNTVTRENLLEEMTSVFENTIEKKFPGDSQYLLRFINCVWNGEQTVAPGGEPCPLQRVDTARLEQINRVLFAPAVYSYFYYDYKAHTPEERGPFRCNPHPMCSEGRTDVIPNYISDRSAQPSSAYTKDLYDIYKAGGGFQVSLCFDYLRNRPDALEDQDVREYLAVMLWGYVCYYAGYDLIERARINPPRR